VFDYPCDPHDGGVDHVAVFGCINSRGPNPALTESDAGAPTAISPAKDDSGCATASGSSTLPLLGSAVGVGILAALRRRRSRKKNG
jgi:MYXO-CTERM domain-containing protein